MPASPAEATGQEHALPDVNAIPAGTATSNQAQAPASPEDFPTLTSPALTAPAPTQPKRRRAKGKARANAKNDTNTTESSTVAPPNAVNSPPAASPDTPSHSTKRRRVSDDAGSPNELTIVNRPQNSPHPNIHTDTISPADDGGYPFNPDASITPPEYRASLASVPDTWYPHLWPDIVEPPYDPATHASSSRLPHDIAPRMPGRLWPPDFAPYSPHNVSPRLAALSISAPSPLRALNHLNEDPTLRISHISSTSNVSMRSTSPPEAPATPLRAPRTPSLGPTILDVPGMRQCSHISPLSYNQTLALPTNLPTLPALPLMPVLPVVPQLGTGLTRAPPNGWRRVQGNDPFWIADGMHPNQLGGLGDVVSTKNVVVQVAWHGASDNGQYNRVETIRDELRTHLGIHNVTITPAYPSAPQPARPAADPLLDAAESRSLVRDLSPSRYSPSLVRDISPSRYSPALVPVRRSPRSLDPPSSAVSGPSDDPGSDSDDSSVELLGLEPEQHWEADRSTGLNLHQRVQREFVRQRAAESSTTVNLLREPASPSHHSTNTSPSSTRPRRCSHCGSLRPADADGEVQSGEDDEPGARGNSGECSIERRRRVKAHQSLGLPVRDASPPPSPASTIDAPGFSPWASTATLLSSAFSTHKSAPVSIGNSGNSVKRKESVGLRKLFMKGKEKAREHERGRERGGEKDRDAADHGEPRSPSSADDLQSWEEITPSEAEVDGTSAPKKEKQPKTRERPPQERATLTLAPAPRPARRNQYVSPYPLSQPSLSHVPFPPEKVRPPPSPSSSSAADALGRPPRARLPDKAPSAFAPGKGDTPVFADATGGPTTASETSSAARPQPAHRPLPTPRDRRALSDLEDVDRAVRVYTRAGDDGRGISPPSDPSSPRPGTTQEVAGASAAAAVPAARLPSPLSLQPLRAPQTTVAPDVDAAPSLTANALALQPVQQGSATLPVTPTTPTTPTGHHYPGRPLPRPPTSSTPSSPALSVRPMTPGMSTTRDNEVEALPAPAATSNDAVGDSRPRPEWSNYTDLDVFIARLDVGSQPDDGRNYEDLLRVSEFVGPAAAPSALSPTPTTAEQPLVGRIEVERRRITKDGRVKLKLTLLGVVVDKCGICLSQFKDEELAALAPMCQHSMSVVVLVLLGLLTFFLYKSWQSTRKSSLPPGPGRLPIIGSVHRLPFGYQQHAFLDWKKTYGDIIYLEIFNKPAVVLNSAKVMQELLDKRGSKYSGRPRSVLISEMIGMTNNVTILPYGDQWRRQRRWFQTAFQSASALESYVPLQRCESVRLLSGILDAWQSTQDKASRDVGKEVFSGVKRYVGALMMQIAYGHSVASLDDEFVVLSERALAGTLEAATSVASLVDFFPFLRYLPPWLPGAGFLTKVAEVHELVRVMIDVPYERVQASIAKGAARPCFLTSLLDEYAKDGKMSAYDEADVKGAANIVYGVIPRLVTEEDTYRSYTIPAGSVVMPNIWAITRDPECYPDADTFRPERFLSSTPEPDPRGFAFGFGRRSCPGQAFGDSSVWLAAARIVAAFDVTKAHDPATGAEVSFQPEFASGMISHVMPFPFEVQPRSERVGRLIRELEAEA
ncbi:hypothetical protein EVJ58_g9483 [Rhodofomes roseus]|uniref:Cytochrome P450 n=1 Tax=Rhodofomes roseus TaxID=34475 RepID=A0A4Y9XVI7_9APHY|nr:hypothetical protein EVJ58_g9483 [Rhodofomes roseus]